MNNKIFEDPRTADAAKRASYRALRATVIATFVWIPLAVLLWSKVNIWTSVVAVGMSVVGVAWTTAIAFEIAVCKRLEEALVGDAASPADELLSPVDSGLPIVVSIGNLRRWESLPRDQRRRIIAATCDAASEAFEREIGVSV